MQETSPVITIKELNKWYGSYHALKDIDLEVALGERIVVCGPSGSGKSTLIRCINALEEHSSGSIVVDGIAMKDSKAVEAIRSEVGMVFQQFNLFPHLTILQNLTLGPIKARGMSKVDAEERAMRYLERVRIPDQAHKRPTELCRVDKLERSCSIKCDLKAALFQIKYKRHALAFVADLFCLRVCQVVWVRTDFGSGAAIQTVNSVA